MHIGLHRFADAVRYARLGIEYSQNTPTVPGPRAQAFNMLAGALMYLGDVEGALGAVTEARKLTDQLPHQPIPNPLYFGLILQQTRCREGLILGEDGGVNLNRTAEAAVVLQQGFEALEDFVKRDAKDYQVRTAVATAGLYLGNILRHSDPKRALEVYDHALMKIREVPDDIAARRQEAALLASSSYAARWIHHESDARRRVDEAFRLLRETKDYPAASVMLGDETDIAMRALADHYAETGELIAALETYQRLRGQIVVSKTAWDSNLFDATHMSTLDASMASLLRRLGRPSEAMVLDQDRLSLWRQWYRKLPNNPFVQRQVAAVLRGSKIR